MNATLNEEKILKAQELMERERDYLRKAYRAQRAALDDGYAGNDFAAHIHLGQADAAIYAASICAEEVRDLLGVDEDNRNHRFRKDLWGIAGNDSDYLNELNQDEGEIE